MSADLLAAFGSPEDFKRDDQDVPQSTIKQTSQAQTLTSTATESSTWQSWPLPSTHQKVDSHRLDESLWKKDATGTDVLFDAEDDQAHPGELDDDFGDFEEVEHLDTAAKPAGDFATTASTGNTVDLLGLEDTTTGQLSELTMNEPLMEDPQPIYNKVATQSHMQRDQALPTTETLRNDDGWDDFDEFEQAQAPSPTPVTQASQPPVGPRPDGNLLDSADTKPDDQQKVTGVEDDFEDWDEFEDSQPSVNTGTTVAGANKSMPKGGGIQSTKEERPTNVPPPAILLQALPKVYSYLAKLASQSSDEVDLGHLTVDAFKVTARIIAGRSHRWKRDTILAQSMRIGASGRSGGMKLTSLDKSENRREEQEIAETVMKWSQNSYALNSIMVKAKVQKPGATLSTNLTAKMVTGADVMTASHVCPVCGLKRNERIPGIDVTVMDTFGEFWIEYWGHKDCHSIWYFCQRNDLLEHR